MASQKRAVRVESIGLSLLKESEQIGGVSSYTRSKHRVHASAPVCLHMDYDRLLNQKDRKSQWGKIDGIIPRGRKKLICWLFLQILWHNIFRGWRVCCFYQYFINFYQCDHKILVICRLLIDKSILSFNIFVLIVFGWSSWLEIMPRWYMWKYVRSET